MRGGGGACTSLSSNRVAVELQWLQYAVLILENGPCSQTDFCVLQAEVRSMYEGDMYAKIFVF